MTEPSKKVRKLVLESMERFRENCENHPFSYWWEPPRELRLGPTIAARYRSEISYFNAEVNRRLSEANARRIERYREHGIIASL